MPRVWVQWATTDPQDWVEIDLTASGQGARRWLNLAKKPLPTDSSTLDANAGWVFDVAIDGVMLYGFDHVAGEPIAGGGLRFYGWVDDVSDPAFLYRWGEVWEFRPHRSDPLISGALNTHQTKIVYAEDLNDMAQYFPQQTSGGPVQLRPWSEWVMPPDNLTRHGIWVRDEALWRRHFDVRRKPDWREWG